MDQTTLPFQVTNLTLTRASTSVTANWTMSDTSNLAGYRLVYKANSYPVSPNDGIAVIVSSASTSTTISGLSAGIACFVRMFPYNAAGKFQEYRGGAMAYSAPNHNITLRYNSTSGTLIGVYKPGDTVQITSQTSYDTNTTNFTSYVVKLYNVSGTLLQTFNGTSYVNGSLGYGRVNLIIPADLTFSQTLYYTEELKSYVFSMK